jgi:(E)-4-hydroxy-3-methylbut-2-enyl-diphosphate synthase
MGIRRFQPLITSCPWCGRTSSDKFQKLAKDIHEEIQKNYHIWQIKYPRFTQTNIAVMWCIVNGPWEAKNADIGIFLPWTGEQVKIPVYIKGVLYKNLEWKDILEQFIYILEQYLSEKI